MSLEKDIESAFNELNISPGQQIKLAKYLKLLKEKDIDTYNHSLAVGLKMMVAVEDKKAGLYCGLLHDIGKIAIDDEILKKSDFTERDMEIMKEHPIYSFIILGEDFAFSSLISLLHHQNQKTSYPIIKKLNTIIGSKNPDSFEKAKSYAQILHEIDAVDASEFRNNNYQDRH